MKVPDLITIQGFMVKIMKINVFWEKAPCGMVAV